LGCHDFTHFANRCPEDVNPKKTLTRFDVIEIARDKLQLEVEGSGFLYKMVRHMVPHGLLHMHAQNCLALSTEKCFSK
jgi:tRNA pseudouridine38-40 synthase